MLSSWARPESARAEVSLGSPAAGPYAAFAVRYAWLRDCLADLLHVRFGQGADAACCRLGRPARPGLRCPWARGLTGPTGRSLLICLAARGHAALLHMRFGQGADVACCRLGPARAARARGVPEARWATRRT